MFIHSFSKFLEERESVPIDILLGLYELSGFFFNRLLTLINVDIKTFILVFDL